MNYFMFILFLMVFNGFEFKNHQNMYKIKTPDQKFFNIDIIAKREADSLEDLYQKNKIQDSFLDTYKRFAYSIDQGKVLYRQFYKSIAFIFPNVNEFNFVVRGRSYFEVTLQPTDKNNNRNVSEDSYSRIAASFSILPSYANNFRKNILKEIDKYESFEGYRFYLLKDSSVVMLQNRTLNLSDGYWFSSVNDFDFFYYVLSGKEKQKDITFIDSNPNEN
jgi:hypothetical protein